MGQFTKKDPFSTNEPKDTEGNPINFGFKYYLSLIGVKGNMAYEYNPLHNYRLTEDTDINGLHPNLALLVNKSTNEKTLLYYKSEYYFNNGVPFDLKVKYSEGTVKEIELGGVKYDLIFYNPDENAEGFISGGTIVDLDTPYLNFSLNNPIEIEAQPSYDGSVNLIINDDRNIPRLINSRFTTRLLNTYEVVDRIGDNDTNLYDDSQFDLDTSLYKRVDKIPKVRFNGVQNYGNLKVGNYTFYFKYCDADENETDFVELSGVISIFRGNDRDPFSIDGGVRDMKAYKSVSFTLSEIDSSYDYIKIYYTRTSSDLDENRIVTAYKINKKYVVRKGICQIFITGEENVTDIAVSDINALYFLASKALTQTQCLNRLFLGNLSKPDIAYQDLTDISLRILPYLEKVKAKETIGKVNCSTYRDITNVLQPGEYYNTQNIYYHVGYWNEELYRIGIVYIMPDGSLSPVFNIRGCKDLPEFNNINEKYTRAIENDSIDTLYDDEGNRIYIKVDEENYSIISGTDLFENSKGVIRINDEKPNAEYIYSIGICIPETIVSYIREVHKIKGFFLVRQKRIPTILALAYTLPYEPSVQVPLLSYGEEGTYAIEKFIDDDGNLTHSYTKRLYTKYSDLSKSLIESNTVCTAICPEFEVRQAYFNQFFTGTQYPIKVESTLPGTLISNGNRFYYADYPDDGNINPQDALWLSAKIVSITDEVPLVAIEDTIFRGTVGSAEEAFRFRYAEADNGGKTTIEETILAKGQQVKIVRDITATNLVRGIFYPYLGLLCNTLVKPNSLITIYIPGFSQGLYNSYFKIRYEDDSPYYPISERVDINNLGYDWLIKEVFGSEKAQVAEENNSVAIKSYCSNFYRGDCYICNFTHRLNRNFLDPEAPVNDEIIDEKSWKDNYNPDDLESYTKINRGDVNAVLMGSWITIRVRSSYNLSIRSLDTSNGGEVGLTGVPRGFYPLLQLTVQGNYKIPGSYLINDGFGATTGEKQFFTLPDVPYIKNNFENRVLYSDIAITDAYKNGYRVFKSTAFRDYKKEYGSIRRLIEWHSSIICVFEHAVASIAVNERLAIGGTAGNEIFINSNNVLPENIAIISDMFGSQWPESVIKTPYFIYGVDTVGKKVWRTNGQNLEIISDFKLNKFLIDNISLSEREHTPIIGVRNVKTHYNANKGDVMFTFYDNTYGFEEKVWNLCYNETSLKFVTFYSWVPSYSENIDNIYFSFNRKTSKYIAKLGVSQVGSTNADGVILNNVILENLDDKLYITGLKNRILPEDNVQLKLKVTIVYFLEKDNFRNYEKFLVVTLTDSEGNEISNNCLPGEIGKLYLLLKPEVNLEELFTKERPVVLLNIRAEITILQDGITDRNILLYITNFNEYTLSNYGYYQSTIAITTREIVNNELLHDSDKEKGSLTTDFWKHGQAGIIDIKEEIKPTYWYGEQHPFEFEFVVRDTPNMHKIFTNLEIVSNSAEPESFHFDIVGDCYEFSDDKANMYYRQEMTKLLYLNMGSDILYDRDYKYIKPKLRPMYNEFSIPVKDKDNNLLFDKSTIFPWYYRRVDTFEDIYDYYTTMGSTSLGQNGKGGKDYKNLSGSEVIWDRTLNEFRVRTHIVNSPINKYGRMRGNSHYKEDRWQIQIPSIIFALKNENVWPIINDKSIPPMVVTNIPEDLLDMSKEEIYSEWDNSKKRQVFGNQFDPETTFDELTNYLKSLVVHTVTETDLAKLGITDRVNNIYNIVDANSWTYRKEAKIKDKYMRVRIRYTGDKLAVITAILTTYLESYA